LKCFKALEGVETKDALDLLRLLIPELFSC